MYNSSGSVQQQGTATPVAPYSTVVAVVVNNEQMMVMVMVVMAAAREYIQLDDDRADR